MATICPPPRTPSPKVRIRSRSFDSPSSRLAFSPIQESPFSKSTGAIALSRDNALKAGEQGELEPANVLLPLHTKMSGESVMSVASSASSSGASSSSGTEEDGDSMSDIPSPRTHLARQRPHPPTLCQSVTCDATPIEEQACSPFLYQDKSYPMYSPWLVRAVLDLYDIRGLDWMSIADPIERFWGVQTNSAEVLSILSDNGRVRNRRWWD
ncbi:hypothetical protein BDU57DRAFT_304563 [Ampelomyces quisqualis]|uniref:Uncharacterized protein n=1 Tax=Ampelomyces quisqualis TaxID=50730 RepID=A0A6A5QHG6_AMPQU|nr:hypothetical protein BDU57DRAFT_304563 [Ampelomyces quisqualis]